MKLNNLFARIDEYVFDANGTLLLRYIIGMQGLREDLAMMKSAVDWPVTQIGCRDWSTNYTELGRSHAQTNQRHYHPSSLATLYVRAKTRL
ncbi:hypothetical protein Plhal304r1_c093g0172741 [Plasmopara halstedii]